MLPFVMQSQGPCPSGSLELERAFHRLLEPLELGGRQGAKLANDQGLLDHCNALSFDDGGGPQTGSREALRLDRS